MFAIIVTIITLYRVCESPALELSDDTADHKIAHQSYMVVNFYVNWCKYCIIFEPEYEIASNLIHSNLTNVIMAKVNCEVNKAICSKYLVDKYPTLKIFRHGETKKEYRGPRTSGALLKYVENDVRTEPYTISLLDEIDMSQNYLFARLKNKSSEEYRSFSQVAMKFVDDCNSYVVINENEPDQISFVYSIDNSTPIFYQGSILSPDLEKWAFEYCRPEIPEITFRNAEELTGEGIPLLILFYNHIDDPARRTFQESLKGHEDLLKGKFKPVFAKSTVFEHALRRMNKVLTDVPLVAVDDFHHLYAFPDFSKINDNEEFKKFITDINHKRQQIQLRIQNIIFGAFQVKFNMDDAFGMGLNEPDEDHKIIHPSHEHKKHPEIDKHPKKDLPHMEHDNDEGEVKSVFKNLAPNEKRYTMARERDEL